MHVGEISFCDKIGFNIKSDEFKKKTLNELESKFSFKIIQKHFEKFSNTSFDIINNNPHMISLRTNGNPYLLYLTTHNNINQCIFIDKKIQHGYFYPRMIIAKLWLSDELFSNTLFDGEMVKDSFGNWRYIINDMIADKGAVLQSWNLIKRLNRIYEILDQQYKHDDMNPCVLEVKRYFYITQLQEMVDNFMPTLNYTCRGVYFKPLFLKFKDILYNFDDDLIKKVVRQKFKDVSSFLLKGELSLKSNNAEEKNNVSHPKSDGDTDKTTTQFLIQKTSQPDIYDVYDRIDTSKSIGVACVNNLSTSKMMRKLFSTKTPADKVLMECQYSDKFKKWIPIEVA